MHITNKLIAMYMAFVIGFVSYASVYEQRIDISASTANIEEPISLKQDIIEDTTIIFETKADEIEIETETIEEIETKPIETVTETQKETEEKFDISDWEIELIALVVMSEAEGECEKGKRLVIDTILNRVDSPHFPNTVNNVIYQPYQFTSMSNGRSDRCYVSKDNCRLVKEELRHRTNNTVMFFTAGHYSSYGTPMFQIGNHYFSSYN